MPRLKPLRRLEKFKENPHAGKIIVQRLAEGETLPQICASMGLPYALTADWIVNNEELNRAVEGAEMLWADNLIKQGLEIVDSANPDDVKVAKLRSDYRKWLGSRLNRKRYGEKVEVSHTGAAPTFNVFLAHETEKVVHEGEFKELEADE